MKLRLLLVCKVLQLAAVFVFLALGTRLILQQAQSKKSRIKNQSLIDSFVFRDKENSEKTIKTKQSNVYIISDDLQTANEITFIQLQESKIHNKTLPRPRSHVTTNSSHVIWNFIHQKGCVFNRKYGILYQYLKIVLVCSDVIDIECRKWIWDPANWTLILTNEQEDGNTFHKHHVCAYPKLTDRVNKVIYPNGSIRYPGCNFNKSPCAIREPYFDVDLHMRINWSPCCRNMMLTMLSHAHNIFEKHRIRYVMTGGAVISVGRDNGTLIPYDTDLDLIVDIRDRDKFSNQSATDMALLGYYYIWNKRGNYIKICQNKLCDAHIDVWFYERYPGDRHMVKYFKLRFWSLRESILFPTSWQLFEGKKYRFPRRIIKYLDHEYSTGLMAGYRNWKTVLLCNHKRGRKCTFYSDKKN